MKRSNALINETSPYLLQHAHNPVDWLAWNEASLEKARAEDKLILVSIGYSACHWCHVMEHESFEDEAVAEVMNNYFVCIKVDREERPDIDQVYMSAVQLMTGRGGWPLNCFTLPDGRPVYGGTYFPKNQWVNILQNLAELYRTDKSRLLDYANQLTDGINKMETIVPVTGKEEFSNSVLHTAVQNWKSGLDETEGGPDRAPKFPLPNNYLFLLEYAVVFNDSGLQNHVALTLKKMAYGGIYDQIGGGFARYSVDAIWKVPHFEKMLYDNAQLISLYALAYRFFKNPLYKQIVYGTSDFIERELTGNEGNFYSAIDADSEKVEGKYYVWKKEELENILGSDFDLFADYFNVNDRGYWEHNNFILLRNEEDETIAAKYHMEVGSLGKKINELCNLLLSERNKRIPPGTDDKTLTSWNALMIIGYLDAYDAFADDKFLRLAEKNCNFILQKLLRTDGGLNHNYKSEKSTINGYLEDYAFFIQALIRLYQCTFEYKWLDQADFLTKYVDEHFYNIESGMYFFTSDIDPPLIARKMELQDNVIPASNSQMARNLLLLGQLLDRKVWSDRAKKMCMNMSESLTGYGSGFSNWLLLWTQLSLPVRELVICGSNARTTRLATTKHFFPSSVVTGGTVDVENILLTKGRLVKNETLIYVCIDHTCKAPFSNAEQALRALTEE